MKIDAHQHFWQYDPKEFDWINEKMVEIKKDFMPDNLHSILKTNNINGCVAVQTKQTDKETVFLNDLALKNDFIKGVVGWTDLLSKTIDDKLILYKKSEKIKGFRHIIQAEPEGFMLNSELQKNINILANYGFTFDVLIKHTQMKEAIKLIIACPYTSFVIDHLAKPNIKDKETAKWSNYIQKLSELPNVMCKLSGMVTETDYNTWKKEDFYKYLDITLANFGIDRVMYGSDWPVCLLAATYQQQLGILESYFSKLTTNEQNKIFGLNAVKFYNLATKNQH
jgi:L-fuconolactonase